MMNFSLVHRFDAPIDTVEALLLARNTPTLLASCVDWLEAAEVLEWSDDSEFMRRRVRYTPRAVVPKVGPKSVPARWQTWTEESVYERARRTLSFVNRPDVEAVAARFENYGTVTLEADGDACIRRLNGVLNVSVFVLGRIAENLIHERSITLLNEEAAATNALLRAS